MRLGTRSAFSNDLLLVLTRDPEDATRPAHLAPDHANGAVQYDSVLGALNFAAAEDASNATCVWVSDAEYADFSVSIDFSSVVPPTVRLGSRAYSDLAGAEANTNCALPTAIVPGTTGGRLRVERHGNSVSLTLGAAHSECEADPGRLAFGVCGSVVGPSRVTQLSVVRGG